MRSSMYVALCIKLNEQNGCHCGSLKVVGMAEVTKSNLHDFWYRCLVIDLALISEILLFL